MASSLFVTDTCFERRSSELTVSGVNALIEKCCGGQVSKSVVGITSEGHVLLSSGETFKVASSPSAAASNNNSISSETLLRSVSNKRCAAVHETVLAKRSRFEKKTRAPCARWGATFINVGKNKYMLYGGEADYADENHSSDAGAGGGRFLGDVHFCELSSDGLTYKWTTPLGCEGSPRAWHTATYIPSSNLVVVMGGTRESEEILDAQLFDCDINLWYPLTSNGKAPCPRMGHSAARFDGTICIFGGCRQRKWFNDVYFLDTKSWRWSQPRIAGIAPEPRTYHSASIISDRQMVILSGNGADKTFSDIHILTSSASNNAPEEKSTKKERKWRWVQPRISKGSMMSARCGHRAVVVHSGALKLPRLVISGGWDTWGEVVEVFADVHAISFDGDADDAAPRASCECIVKDDAEEHGGMLQRTGHAASVSPDGDMVFVCGQGPPPDSLRFGGVPIAVSVVMNSSTGVEKIVRVLEER